MSNLSRRQFLDDVLWSATATAVAASINPTFAAEERQSTSPNERLRVAVLGVGKRGIDHAMAFAARRDTEVAIICDVDSEVGQRRCDELHAKTERRPRYKQDLRKVLDDKTIDVVSIALPNHWHALAAIWAMQAGKDVYLEKPVSHSVAEGRAIVKAARKHQRICQTGTQHRSLGGLRDAMAYLHAGRLGKVTMARGICYKARRSIGPAGNYTPPSTVNYDLWCGPAPVRPVTRKQFHYDWHWFWDYGNGEVGNQGVHQMDMARWGLGVDTLCSSVLSYGGRFGFNDAGETANTHVLIFDYGPKSLVFEVRALKTDDLRGVRIGVIFEGTKGCLVWNSSLSGGTVFDPDGHQVTTFAGRGGDHFDNFVKGVRTRNIKDLHADIVEGHFSSALCHLGNISYRLGNSLPAKAASELLSTIDTANQPEETFHRTVKHLNENKIDTTNSLRVGAHLSLDSKTEHFLNNPRANELLQREYRPPYRMPPIA
jgi:predicted dehydrogenase